MTCWFENARICLLSLFWNQSVQVRFSRWYIAAFLSKVRRQRIRSFRSQLFVQQIFPLGKTVTFAKERPILASVDRFAISLFWCCPLIGGPNSWKKVQVTHTYNECRLSCSKFRPHSCSSILYHLYLRYLWRHIGMVLFQRVHLYSTDDKKEECYRYQLIKGFRRLLQPFLFLHHSLQESF